MGFFSSHFLGKLGNLSDEEGGLAIASGWRWLVAIDKAYVHYFSEFLEHGEAYKKFISMNGRLMKDEWRTTITLLSRAARNGGCPSYSFVFKEYLYPNITGIRTFMQVAKALREYRGLRQCQIFGIPVAQPVGFGVQRHPTGMIRSCFIVSRFIHNAIDFRAWLKGRDQSDLEHCTQLVSILGQLGRHLHRLHEKRFFLTKPTPRNILIRDSGTSLPKAMFVDPVRAQFLFPKMAARYGQAIDIGALFGPLLRRTGAGVLDPFLETYLPDPLGRSTSRLRKFIIRSALAHNKKTVFAWVSHRIHRVLRRPIRMVLGRR